MNDNLKCLQHIAEFLFIFLFIFHTFDLLIQSVKIILRIIFNNNYITQNNHENNYIAKNNNSNLYPFNRGSKRRRNFFLKNIFLRRPMTLNSLIGILNS